MSKKRTALASTPTQEQFQAFNDAYQYFNRELFGGQLAGCILNFSRKSGTHGFVAPRRWKRAEEDGFSTHELSLTPQTLYREPILVFSTLVHEQCHIWQIDLGNPSRGGYHNKEWADKMEEVGLMPSDTGEPGGKKTGQHMTHYIIPGGRYEKAFNKMPEQYKLPFVSLDGHLMKAQLTGVPGLITGKPEGQEPGGVVTPKSKDKVKYTCPGCGINVWGKPGLKLRCDDCNQPLMPNEK